jgi:peptidoglycan/LPS O-acetylase OafA/YrhL
MVVGPDFPLQINETGSPDFPLTNWEILKAFVKELFIVRYWHHPALLWNAPAWSVSLEWFAYLTLFPLAFICFRRIRSWLILAVLVMLFLILQSFLPLEKYGGK